MISFFSLMRYYLFYIIFFIHLLNGTRASCVKTRPKHSEDYEVKCVKIDNIRDLSSQLGSLLNTSQLTLSNNNISILYSQSFPLPKLIKLDLNKNSISHIEKGAFLGLDNLKSLSLANNKLKTVSKEIFEGLTSLEILKLNQNSIATVPFGVFNDLPSLSKLNIVGNPLICDCNLLWLLQKPTIKLTQGAKCVDPPHFRGVVIEKAHKSSVNICGSDFNVLSLTPNESLIVMQHDPLRIRCKVSEFAISNDSVKAPLFWTFNDVHTIVESSQHIQITYPFVEDPKLLYSDFTIKKTSDVHAGEWICNFRSKHVNQSVGIKVIVFSEKTNYCDSTVTKDNKGIYAWPQTPAFSTVILPCKNNVEDIENSTRPNFASYACGTGGKWIDYNTTNCPYVSAVTKILYQFSKMNLTYHKASLLESAKRLRNFTNDNLVKMSDPTDLSYILATIENYLTYLPSENELGPLLMEIIGTTLKIPSTLLHEAQRQYAVCSRLLRSIETISRHTPSFEYQNSHLSLKKFHISSETFTGLTCTWLKHDGSFLSNCSVSNGTTKNSNIEISVQIPSNFLYSSDMESMPSTQILMIGTFNDNGLFLEKINNTRYSILPPVIAANLVGVKSSKLEDPVYVILKNYYPALNPQLAWWDTDAGMWIKDGCSPRTHTHTNLLIFQCHRTGYFALLTDRTNITSVPDTGGVKLRRLAEFQILPIFIYIGTFVCITCLLMLAVLYILFYTRIESSRTVKHAKINMWLSTSLFCIIFCLGIWRTNNQIACQIIGLAIHYFALSTFFWMAVIIKKLYRCVQKNHPSMTTPSEDVIPVGEVIVRKRILGIYLVGWGISVILCGISGAVNLQGYAGDQYCFLTPGPSLSTVLIPASLILLYLCIMCLLVNCATGNVDSNPQLSVGTQAIDLELLDTAGHVSLTQEHSSIGSVTSPASSQAEDLHHSPGSQLRVFVIFLALYLSLLICAAGSIVLLPPSSSYSNSSSDDDDTGSSSSSSSSSDGGDSNKRYFGLAYLIVSICISVLEFCTYYIRRMDVRMAVCDMKPISSNPTTPKFQSISAAIKTANPPNICRSGGLVATTSSPLVRLPLPPLLLSNNNNGNTVIANNNNNKNEPSGISSAARINVVEPDFMKPLISATANNNLNNNNNNSRMNMMFQKQQRCHPLLLTTNNRNNNNNNNNSNHINGAFFATATDNNFYNPHQSIAAKKFFRRQRRKRNTLIARRCRSGGSSPVSITTGYGRTMFEHHPSSLKPSVSTVAAKNNNAVVEADGSRSKFLISKDCCDPAAINSNSNSNNNHHHHRRRDEQQGFSKALDEVVLSDTSFAIPEYEELPTVRNYDRIYSDRYDRVYNSADPDQQQQPMTTAEGHNNDENNLIIIDGLSTREQMCGTSDRDWCSYDTVSDVNSEPTYNYAFVDRTATAAATTTRDGYNSCQSMLSSDRSSSTSHLYATVAPDLINVVNPALVARCRNFEYVRATPSVARSIINSNNNNVTFPPTQTKSNFGFNTGPNCFFSSSEARKRKCSSSNVATVANRQRSKNRDALPASDNNNMKDDDKVETRV